MINNQHVSTAPAATRRPKIMVVDDDLSVTRIAKAFLERIGNFEVEIVNDPQLALISALKFRPDAVLLDVHMPGIDGAGVAAAFKADYLLRDTPILFLTGLVDRSGSFQQEIEFDGTQFLGKPFSPKRLIDGINRMLGVDSTVAGADDVIHRMLGNPPAVVGAGIARSTLSASARPSPLRTLTQAA